MIKYRIAGPDAVRLLNRVVTRDIDKLKVGQIYYTGWCDEAGKMIDDGTVSRLDESSYRLTAAEPNLRWLSLNAIDLEVEITDETDSLGALSLQGPNSASILSRCCEHSVNEIKYFHFTENTINGNPITISRTGYTGDLGYEIWMDKAHALPVWDALFEAGEHFGIVPVGILAMDIARIEAGLFMIEVDYTSANHAWIESQKSSPYELGLGWTVNLNKQGYFVGRPALELEKREGSAWKMVGLDVDWEGMEKFFKELGLPPNIPTMAVRTSLPVMVGNVQVGYVTSSTWSPLLKKYVALAHLQKPYYEFGTNVQMEITVEHHRQHSPAKVVKLPFYDPAWKRK